MTLCEKFVEQYKDGSAGTVMDADTTQALAMEIAGLQKRISEYEEREETLKYVLQDDLHNRLTPRIVDMTNDELRDALIVSFETITRLNRRAQEAEKDAYRKAGRMKRKLTQARHDFGWLARRNQNLKSQLEAMKLERTNPEDTWEPETVTVRENDNGQKCFYVGTREGEECVGSTLTLQAGLYEEGAKLTLTEPLPNPHVKESGK